MLDHIGEYAKATDEWIKLPQDVLFSAYTAQRTSPIVIDTAGSSAKSSFGSLLPPLAYAIRKAGRVKPAGAQASGYQHPTIPLN